MKKCKYCAMDVPDAAKICPYCRKQITTSPYALALAVLIGLLVVRAVFNHVTADEQPPAASSPQEIAAQKERSEKSDAKWMARQYVEARLKAPSTAKWPNYNDFAATRVIDKKGVEVKDTWNVAGHVDSQNGYGAMLRTKFFVTLRKTGKEWSLVEIADY